ncbi:hypothetical protein [Saccharothrix xinjiangensis]|uniref:Uncharacterized protein n=1 Tax=Saccharothrix xinjiangensis TaxID=204798 RepID=A0ABV9XV41_9PSEU
MTAAESQVRDLVQFGAQVLDVVAFRRRSSCSLISSSRCADR